MPSSEPKNHHYIPRAQLKLFGIKEYKNSILQYNKETQKLEQKNIEKTACIRKFYRVEDDSVTDPLFAEKFFGKIESIAISLIRQLSGFEEPQKVTSEQDEKRLIRFFIFLVMQEFRTVAGREAFETLVKSFLFPLIAEHYKDDDNFDINKLSLTMKNKGHIHFLRNVILRLSEYYIANCRLIFAYSHKNSQFIITDNPVLLYSHPTNPHKGGIYQSGAYKFFPLSCNLGVFVGKGSFKTPYEIILSKEETRKINVDLASQARQYIYGSSKTQIERIIKAINNEKFMISDYTTVNTIPVDISTGIIHVKTDRSISLHQSIRYKLEPVN